ncbi:hypothetical protein McPS_29700 [Marichromatium sp. PS1]
MGAEQRPPCLADTDPGTDGRLLMKWTSLPWPSRVAQSRNLPNSARNRVTLAANPSPESLVVCEAATVRSWTC